MHDQARYGYFSVPTFFGQTDLLLRLFEFEYMKNYLKLLQDVLENGEERKDRTGTGTIGVFGRQLRFDLNDHWVHIWDEWADERGDLGPIYGEQWRRCPNHLPSHFYDYEYDDCQTYIDQISSVVNSLRNNPASRRHIVSSWNVGMLDMMELPPCHILFQFYVSHGNRLSLQLYQRSADMFLGVPFNIASYSLLLMMIAQVTGYEPYEFIHTFGDTHIYLNHVDQVREQLSREPRDLPRVELNKEVDSIFDFKYEDIKLVGYYPHPAIKGDVSV